MKKIIMAVAVAILGFRSISAITLAEWANRLYVTGKWEYDRLAEIQQDLANDMTSSDADTKYKAAIQHAIATVALVAERSEVKECLKAFGYDFDRDEWKFNPDTTETVNGVVDQAVNIGVPAIETAIRDLGVIPSSWSGSVYFSRSEWRFLDEDVYVDYGDVLYLKSCLNAALGVIYLSQGYDLDVNFKACYGCYSIKIPVVASRHKGKIEDGTIWEMIDYVPARGPMVFPEFGQKKVNGVYKIVQCDDNVYVYRERMREDDTLDNGWEWVKIDLIDPNTLRKKITLYTGYGLWQKKEKYVVYKVSSWGTGLTFGSGLGFAKLDGGYRSSSGFVNSDWWVSRKNDWIDYFLLKESNFGTLRSKSALTSACGHVKTAIELAIEADQKVIARKDWAYHFFDYDQDSEDQKQARDMTIAYLRQALESLNGNAAVDVNLGLAMTDEEREAFGLQKTERIDISRLFSGDVTRALLPPSVSSDYYASSVGKVPDATFGGVFPSLTQDRILAMGNAHEEAKKFYTLVFNGGGVSIPDMKCRMGRVYKLPEGRSNGGDRFVGWRCWENNKLYDGGMLFFDLTKTRGKFIAMTAITEHVAGSGVQLWENGPYWAECNVGATKPEEPGYYFWWGDTVGYKRNASNSGWISVKDSTGFSFDSGHCPTYDKNNSQLQLEGYIDASGNLVAAHDAATAHLGTPWRMPTDAEFSALISNCTTTWTMRNGVAGRLVTGKGVYASKSIFLPAAGYGYDSYLYYLGSNGFYWSSTPNSDYSYYAWYLDFGSGYFYRNYYSRNYGRSVRPVRGFAQ